MKQRISQISHIMMSALLLQAQLITAQVAPQAGENIWHLIASIGTEVDQIAVNQDTCCAGTFTSIDSMSSKIDLLTQIVESDFAGTFTAIAGIECSGSSACQPTPLTAPLTIKIPGNYCMNSNLSGDITINASNVTINMNGFALDGSILLSNGIQNIVIQDGLVAPSAAALGSYALDNSAGASYVTFQNLNVVPTAAGVGGITSAGSNFIIQNCIITPSAGAVNAIGVLISGISSNVIIKNNTISGADNTAGGGGDAINLGNASNVMVVQCIIPTTGNAGGFGSGGVGINNIGSSSQIIECIIKNTGNGAGIGLGGGSGGTGMLIASGATKSLIKDCIVLNTGNGSGMGNGGLCILDQGRFTVISGCQVATAATGAVGVSAIAEVNTTSCMITNCVIQQTAGTGLSVSGCTKLEVSNCTFANIGGLAIQDTLSAGTGNVYFSNFAYNVTGSAGIIYSIPADSAVDGANGTAFTNANAENRLANVYKV